MRTPLNTRRFYLLALPVAMAAFVAGTAFTWKDENNYYYKVNKGLEVFGQVYREVSQSYVDEIEPEEFINAGIEGMLNTLDPYTVYLKKREAADIDLLTTGAYGGIGITVGLRDSMVTVIDVVDGYSAQQEGIRIGDRVMMINGTEVLRGPVESLREYTRGEPGTTVSITVLRDGAGEPITFTLTRENIKVHSVGYSGMVAEGIGYIRLERFSANAGDEMRTALLDLRKQGALGGLILDLRDNPGGLLESAVDVASKFVPNQSVIVSTHGRDSAEDRVYRSHEEPIALGIPLIVLVNEGSASAAEIVAGAIQDLDVGVIMGTPSFGKGLVQTVRRLPYESSLKITTARYYTPSGRSIQKIDYAAQRPGLLKVSADTTSRNFRTQRGRNVTEHGGIRPDTLVAEPSLPAIVAQLRDASVFFKFATRYSANLRSLPEDFAVDNNLLLEFERFVAANETGASSLDSSSIMKAETLLATARSEGYDNSTIRRIEELREELKRERQGLLSKYREEVRDELYSEIVARFRGQRERRTAQLTSDSQIQTAAALLRSGRHAYSRILSTR